MKKLLLFFTRPYVGGFLSLIGLLELVFDIPSCFFFYKVPLWISGFVLLLIISIPFFVKRLRIWYYVHTYTSDCFGSSYIYKWRWIKTSTIPNIYGYFPKWIEVETQSSLNPNISTIDFEHHYIENQGNLNRYIMLGLFNKVENSKQTKMIMWEVNAIEA